MTLIERYTDKFFSHLKYTLPPAALLSLLYFPLWTRLDSYKLLFLIAIAVTSTIPWDSYLIRTNIWSYPSNVVVGFKIAQIPIEEVFFFVIQTYNTGLLYLITSKAVLKEALLEREDRGRVGQQWKYIRWGGQMGLGIALRYGVKWVHEGKEETYLGLILIWALPFLLLLWSLAYQLLVNLPASCTLLSIAIPTVYLWVVDTLALQRGTWVISQGTKTGGELWPGLEIEEAVFFFLTNCLIVFGLVAFDNAVAVLNAFPAHFRNVPELPSPWLLVKALLLPASTYDDDRILGLQQSVARLKRKSRSFYLASSTFQGRLRIDLIILYSFCRVADDLIDNAENETIARDWLKKLSRYLDLSYGTANQNGQGKVIPSNDMNRGQATLFITQNFPPETQLALILLPTHILSKEPLYELLKGFEMDLKFASDSRSNSPKPSISGPIKSEQDLDLYGARVAGTVALLCIQLVLHHNPSSTSDTLARKLMLSGHDMGVALQYTNIARDLAVDAKIGRCYVPAPYLSDVSLNPAAFVAGLTTTSKVEDKFWAKVNVVRQRLLDRAFKFYDEAIPAVEELPIQARGPMRVAVESYMQIGRELRARSTHKEGSLRMIQGQGRATVPKWKRIWVGWRRLLGPAQRKRS